MFARIRKSILLLLAINCLSIFLLLEVPGWIKVLGYLAAIGYLIGISVHPVWKRYPSEKLRTMAGGNELLLLFLVTVSANIVLYIGLLIWGQPPVGGLVWQAVLIILSESVLFWSGMLRIFFTSQQLGITLRIVSVLLGCVPVANIVMLLKMRRTVGEEVELETEKLELNQVRAESEVCKTRYPILMVHGVFFRDIRFFNYWGRIPGELMKNGATIYYGEQQSAESVASCGEELAERIRQITEQTGCEKVNVIAHSKGGLDMRYAISCLGADAHVASLTTINTPHRGCIFAEYLLHQIPGKAKQSVAHTYNATLSKLGDKNPDFLAAVTDLTNVKCEELNRIALDKPGVYYQSVSSKMNRAASGRFPLNMSYPLVKHFDGDNDGLVAVEAAKWGEQFTFLSVPGVRGISHGDMIDLNRENIREFDVREFYVNLVKGLKERGL